MPQELDEVDIAILNSLIEDGRKSFRQIVREIKEISQVKTSKVESDSSLSVKVTCDFCNEPIHGSPKVMKFANLERFFCCTSCRSLYKEKYGGRIRSLSKEINEI